jgi:peroxiredoxin
MKRYFTSMMIIAGVLLLSFAHAFAQASPESIYQTGELKPRDSELKVSVGDKAPDFTLPSINHGEISLRSYLGKSNVVLSFVPAAWTPVCTGQWPGYNIAQELFDANETILFGISVDNIPTLWAWTREMGTLWFPVLSDFWPHGEVASSYGVLRGDGTAERALFVIDKRGIIRYIDVHDINASPRLEVLIKELEKLN